MFVELSYHEFIKLAASGQRIAVYKEIPGDRLSPINAYLSLADVHKEMALLESSPKEKHLGRYSHLCFIPVVSITSYADQVQITESAQTKTIIANPFAVLREYQAKFNPKALIRCVDLSAVWWAL